MMFKNYDQFLHESKLASQFSLLTYFFFSVSSLENTQDLGRFYKFRFRVLVYEDRLIFMTDKLTDPFNDEVLYIDKKGVKFEDLNRIQLTMPIRGDFIEWFSLDKDSTFSSKAATEKFAVQQLQKMFELIDSKKNDGQKNDKKALFQTPIFTNWWNKKEGMRTGIKYGL